MIMFLGDMIRRSSEKAEQLQGMCRVHSRGQRVTETLLAACWLFHALLILRS